MYRKDYRNASLFFRTAILISLFATSLASYAGNNWFGVKANVRDKEVGYDITDADYRVLELPDSTVVRTGKTFTHWINYDKETIDPVFHIYNLDSNKKYLLEISAPRYDTLTVGIDPSKLGKREEDLILKNLELIRTRTLQDITVRATKVKFYHKGDTIVYNADAFILAEGSMLDALISQLPGAELKDNGQIYVNGRYVENLLLNGKDFFKGNNKILLDNLGAYTVKNIAVYEAQNEMDKIMGKDYGKKEYTMDVRLKKEFLDGLILNVEAGYGYKDKFLGRLFGLWFNKWSALGFFGNVNNISNTWKPQQNGTSSMPQNTSADITTYSGGLNYDVTIKRSPFKVTGNADIEYQKTENDIRTYVTNFLQPHYTYGYSFSNSNVTTFKAYTEHTFKALKDNWNCQITPKFRFTRNTLRSRLISATFDREWDEIDRSFLEGIYSGDRSKILSSMINRNVQDNEKHGNEKWFNIWSDGKYKINSTDAIRYLLAYTYENKRGTQDELYVLNMGDNPNPVMSDLRHYNNRPDFNWRAKAHAGYIFALAKGTYLDFTYTYQKYFSRTTSELYRTQDYVAQQTGNDLSSFAPSAMENYGLLDRCNSFASRYYEDNHELGIKLDTYIANKVPLFIEVPITYRRQRLHYMRGDIDARIDRNKLFLGNLNASVNIHVNKAWIYIGATRKVTSPDMVNMVDFTNSLDPLNIMMGNPDLKDADSNNLRIYYSETLDQAREMRHGYSLQGTVIRNAIAYGYTYDMNTGVKTGRMYNVMGNADYSASQSFSTAFGYLNCMNIGNYTRLMYVRSADLVSSNSSEPVKNIVNNYGINESVNLSFTKSFAKITGSADVTWNRYTSHLADFNPFNAWNMRYTLSGNFTLPANFSINTDFNIYARRGYSEPSLNTTNFVWNARLSYRHAKTNLLFMLDGFDILHNLKNINYTINAQARTETYSGVVPRYFLFHIQWQFSKKPRMK